MFTLEDDRKTRKISTKAVARGRGRHYVADWMTGRLGTAVRPRYMPHHDHEVEVFDAATGNHLGAATLADQASAEQVKAVRTARARKARQLRAGLVAAERLRRGRYAAATTAAPAQRLGAMTAAEAGRELADADLDELARLARPDLLPHPPPAAGWGSAAWARPASHSSRQRDQPGGAVTGCRNPGLDIADERADHYLALPGAHIVATDDLLMVRDNLGDVLDAKAMMCVHGSAGLGKTLSVNASLRDLAPDAVCRIQFRARPTPRDIRHVLFEALDIGGDPPAEPIEFDTVLKDVLSQRFRGLVCDEAQWLSRECFEYWRHLWDDRRTDIAIVFVGGGDCYQMLRREPMLSSRVHVWQEFQRLPREQVLRIIPAYHPVWERTDLEVIAFADAHAGHGNFRSWAKFTAHATRALRRLDRQAVNREVLGWVFSKLTGRTA